MAMTTAELNDPNSKDIQGLLHSNQPAIVLESLLGLVC